MARYTGPKTKIARRFGEPIFGPDKILAKRNFPPGQHGVNRRKKSSEYGIQLNEKQKAKYTYGVLERQFRNLFEKASATKGITGEVLLQLLETRLDNVVYRLGIAPTRAAARQLVSHCHIVVDGDDKYAVSHQLVEPANNALVIYRIYYEGIDFLSQLVDNAALFINIEAAHAAPKDFQAVVFVFEGGFAHRQQHVLEEGDTVRGDEYADDVFLLSGGQCLASRVGLIIQLPGGTQYQLAFFGFHIAAIIEDAVYGSSGNTAELGDLFYSNHKCHLLSYIIHNYKSSVHKRLTYYFVMGQYQSCSSTAEKIFFHSINKNFLCTKVLRMSGAL